MKDLVRNFLGLIFLLGMSCLFGFICIALFIANYLACKSSFDYLGYDQLPLVREDFIGQIIGPFIPNATLSHLYAFVLAAVIAAGLFVLYNRLFHISDLVKERRTYLAQQDMTSAKILLHHIYEDVALIITMMPCLTYALLWDFELFKYRSIVGALGIEDPTQAPLAVAKWDHQIKSHGHLYAWTLASVGAWGYLAITGLSCSVLEFCFRRTKERFMRLLNNVEHIFQPAMQREALYGYDADMQPIYDPAVPVAYDVSRNPVEFYGYDSEGYPVYDSETPLAYDTGGNPIQPAMSAEPAPADERASSSLADAHRDWTEARQGTASAARQPQNESLQSQAPGAHETWKKANTQASHVERATSGASGHVRRPLFKDTDVFPNISGRRTENAPLQDVIGKPGDRVCLAEALIDKERYWVDPDTLTVWDRDYRSLLFPGTC